ncbi:MAG: FAD-binding oxidoreductase [Bdellovibrionota bacterium]
MIPWDLLRARLSGELSLQTQDLEDQAEDASLYRALPAAVAFPRNSADCCVILEFCRANEVSLHARGAGTSRGGQPLGAGLVVNFRRHMNRILGFDEKTGILTTEPGAFYSEVQKFLKPFGRSFPPDPSYHQCTIAGMIANNAAGIHSVKYGGTVDHVAGLKFLTSDGAVHDSAQPDSLSERVSIFLRRHQATIQAEYPKVEKNSAGYHLDCALRIDGTLDLAKLFTGSEGTLGLLTECRLSTVPLPAATALSILYFSSLEDALVAAMELKQGGVSACELVDKVLLDLHEAAGRAKGGPKHAKKITGNKFLDLFYELEAEAILVAETEGETAAAARAALDLAMRPVKALSTSSGHGDDCALIWDLRRHTSPILNRLENGKISIKPLWGVEDVSLPPSTFLAYVAEQKEMFARFGLTCSFFGHAASCNLHIDPLAVDPRQARVDSELARLYDTVAAESYALVVKHGGSISGEHGDGLSRTAYLPLQYPRCAPLFAELKAMFDPHAILNPGKIVANPVRL